MSKLMDSIKAKAKTLGKTIVLPEGEDDRILTAARTVTDEKIAKIIVLGDEKAIADRYAALGLSMDGITVINPKTSPKTKEYAAMLYELRKAKGMTEEVAAATTLKPLYFGALMVKAGDADGMVGGAINSTGDLLRPALQIIKTAPGISSVSGVFIMCLPEGSKYGENNIMVFGDCAVNIAPDSAALAATAIASAQTARTICGIHPKVAMLSFSTKGSAKHEQVDKVTEATRMVHELAPDLECDGELQVDAALVETVAALKAPGSKVAGHANVLIFPSLEAGNIGYKLTQRLGGADALGPINQGLAKPVNDLSRGCSAKDVVEVVAITALQA